MILVSDTHLSRRVPEAQANWEAVLRYLSATAPDLVIHLGDLSMDGAHDVADLQYARRQLDRLDVPWHALPGNHDIGDNPWPGAPDGYAVDASRVQRWLDIVGPDRWSLTVNGWTLLGLNAQLAGSGLAAEAAQWSWLEQQLGESGAGQPVALVMHKPLAATEAELAAAPIYRFLPAPARQRIADLFGGSNPRWSSAATCISIARSGSTAPITGGYPRRGRSCRTRCSQCWERSSPGSSHSNSAVARCPNRSSLRPTASRS